MNWQKISINFRIVGICLGIPPKTFTWEYYDKSKKHHKIGPISPKDFYKLHVQEHFNVSEKNSIYDVKEYAI